MISNTRKNLALVIALTLTAPLLAQAEGFYGTAQLGVSQQINDSQAIGNNIAVDPDFPAEFDAGDGTVGGIGLGYVINQQFRVEARIAYRESSFNETQFGTGARNGEEYRLNGEIKSTTLSIEGFYDFQNSTAFTPYIKAGLGMADNSYSAKLGGAGVAAFDAFDGQTDGFYDAYADDDSTGLTWNLGFGGNYQLSDTTSIYAEYQYASFGDVQTGQDSFTDGFEIGNLSSNELSLGLRIHF
ncbi:outer membrane beta-barrel protein [Paraglaciecola aquimarina]|uniref:Outer membrane beta-barrel protein n=1 Tax=Paraglaciecola aquimarina TaxID=1235557 RepID=A0ABU3T246_9ALTE|nr:outer membrane beta-barrel protein [Paraglaciecola aquimarina]MDU0356288.1 outer membrane beta-barrel protein [Paraglaciecola aquimarina]